MPKLTQGTNCGPKKFNSSIFCSASDSWSGIQDLLNKPNGKSYKGEIGCKSPARIIKNKPHEIFIKVQGQLNPIADPNIKTTGDDNNRHCCILDQLSNFVQLHNGTGLK